MLSINNDLQQLFSKVSYDFNPLHTQELYALKSMFGKQVVHGIHQLFYVLEDFSKDYRKKYYISKIDVKFEKALGVNEVF